MSDPATRLRGQRRLLVGSSPTQQGLDGVVAVETDGAGTFTLELHFVPGGPGKPAVPPGLEGRNVRVLSPEGHPAEGLEVVAVDEVPDPEAVTARVTLRASSETHALALVADPRPYHVRLVRLPHLDPLFSSAPFSFSGLPREDLVRPSPDDRSTDGAPVAELRPRTGAPPWEVDYLAKDYQSFRSLILDQMAIAAPGWRERNPSDLGVTVAEVLAYAADSLSYYQDAVATEAYLWTARRRISVRRHARLVGYRLGEGENARAWVRVTVQKGTSGQLLPRGTQLLTRSGSLPNAISFPSPEYDRALAQGAQVFETQEPVQLHQEHQEMRLHTWGAEDYTLPAGATEAALRGHRRHLAAGDVLILEEARSPRSGRTEEAAAEQRWAVRLAKPPRLTVDPAAGAGGWPITEIAWAAEDALPFSLAVAARIGGELFEDLAVARGNVVLADHGRTVIEPLVPAPPGGRYEPVLRWPDLTFQTVLSAHREPARTTVDGHAREVRPAVTLIEVDPALFDPRRPARPEDGNVWRPAADLLASRGSDRHFVVEVASDGRALLRFGDGRYGRRPAPGACFWAVYRVGNGPEGNVGAEGIGHVVTADPLVTGATNPLPARGGVGRESLDHARLHAPPLWDRQDRCVSEEDFETHALAHPEVLAAKMELHCTPDARTAVLSVQRRRGLPVDEAFRRQVAAVMEPYLVAGDRLEVRPAQWAPLEIHLEVRVASASLANVVERRLRRAFDSRDPEPGGEPGFFYPDRFTFGQPVYLSQLIEHASRVPGVEEVVPRTFRRWGETGEAELTSGRIAQAPLEIARVAGRPRAPQLGTIRFTVGGPR